jgi:16S rRNA (uracil1498-N3)-methyltransferase
LNRAQSGFRPRFFVDAGAAASRRTAPGLSAERTAHGVLSADSAHHVSDPVPVEVALDAEDSHHATKVLRLRPGDECEVVIAPTGAVCVAWVSALGDPVRLRVGPCLEGDAAGASYRGEVWLVQALARPAVMDYIIEKGTEVGASRFLLFPAAGSPRLADDSLAGRLTRWQKVAREAARQSKQVAIPAVDVVGSLHAAAERAQDLSAFSMVLEPGASRSLDEAVGGICGNSRGIVAVWIGPEGGWTKEELDGFAAGGAEPVRLGRSVLRTETAGPVAVALVRLGLRDW